MKTDAFALDVEAARERVARLWQRAKTPLANHPELLLEAIEELHTALEELQVAEEEARAQNEQLAIARMPAETERQRYQDLFQAAPDGYLVTDASGTILEANNAAAALLQVPVKYLVGKPLVLFVSALDTDAFYVELTRRCQEDKPQEWILQLRPREQHDRGLVYASLSVKPVHDERGRLTAVRWLLRDVSERRQAEARTQRLNEELERRVQELVDAHQRKDEFLAMLGHELRGPLAPILTALHILRERPTDPSIIDWSCNVIARQVRQMTRMVDDLLDISRIACGKIELRLEWVDLATITSRAIETTRHLIEERGHRLTVVVPREPIWLRADPARLEQVLCNLLHNAAKYTDVGGQISLEATREGTEAVVRVRDTGIGMAPELLQRVFDPFVQGDRSIAPGRGGLGIGLALVHSLVHVHGGSVQADSAGPGQGSEFTIRLPGTGSAPEQEPDKPTARPDGRALHVLVVDDNADAARSLAVLLQLWGHEVTLAPDGPAALTAASEHQPDVVLLDIALPGMDGYQVARRLLRLPGMAKAVLIAMTGYGQEQDRRLSQEAGFQHHLVKPVDLEALQNLLAGFSTKAQS